jgi:hypothetical protein
MGIDVYLYKDEKNHDDEMGYLRGSYSGDARADIIHYLFDWCDWENQGWNTLNVFQKLFKVWKSFRHWISLYHKSRVGYDIFDCDKIVLIHATFLFDSVACFTKHGTLMLGGGPGSFYNSKLFHQRLDELIEKSFVVPENASCRKSRNCLFRIKRNNIESKDISWLREQYEKFGAAADELVAKGYKPRIYISW